MTAADSTMCQKCDKVPNLEFLRISGVLGPGESLPGIPGSDSPEHRLLENSKIQVVHFVVHMSQIEGDFFENSVNFRE